MLLQHLFTTGCVQVAPWHRLGKQTLFQQFPATTEFSQAVAQANGGLSSTHLGQLAKVTQHQVLALD